MRAILIAFLTGLLLMACGQPAADQDPEAAAETAAVSIEDFVYEPETLEVTVGTEITWTNQDDFAHTVTAGVPDDPDTAALDGVLGDLGEMNAAGTTFTTSFDEPGTVRYFCRFHPTMQATVVVTD